MRSPVDKRICVIGAGPCGLTAVKNLLRAGCRSVVSYEENSVIGGNWAPATDTIELWDPKTSTFAYAPYKLTKPRGWHGSALVRDGTILTLGGYQNGCTPTDTVDQIDPAKGVVTTFANLPHWNTELNAVTLLDGSILGVGGGECGASSAYPDLDFLPGAPGPR